MIHFRVREDSPHSGAMVEVRRDGKVLAGIYGHRDGIRVVSKYIDGTRHEASEPPSVVLLLSSEPAATPGGST